MMDRSMPTWAKVNSLQRKIVATGCELLRLGRKRNLDAWPRQNNPTGKSFESCQVPPEKYSDFRKWQISLYDLHPVPTLRGVSRTSQTWDGLRWTRAVRETSAQLADGQAVWFWHPDAGVKFAVSPASDGGKSAWLTGEITEQLYKHCAGNAGCFRCDRGVTTTIICRGAPASGIPRAL